METDESVEEAAREYIAGMMRTLARASKTVVETGASETGPLAPPPWPRNQMTIMYRYVATAAGMPARCPERRCQRTGVCQGGPGKDQCDACRPLWSEAEESAVDAAFLALLLSRQYEWVRRRTFAELIWGEGCFNDAPSARGWDLVLGTQAALTPC